MASCHHFSVFDIFLIIFDTTHSSVLSRDLNSGLPCSKPTHYQLGDAANTKRATPRPPTQLHRTHWATPQRRTLWATPHPLIYTAATELQLPLSYAAPMHWAEPHAHHNVIGVYSTWYIYFSLLLIRRFWDIFSATGPCSRLIGGVKNAEKTKEKLHFQYNATLTKIHI